MGTAGQRPRHAEVLDALRQAGRPLGVADVAAQLGVHPNTARFHLDALVTDGAAISTLEPPAGPGRPRTVYRLRPGMDRGGPRSYRLLAQILLSHLSSAGPEATETAAQAGRAWGGFLIGPSPPFQDLTAEAAIARLAGLLDELGFAPETEPGTAVPAVIRLRHCPFLELAEGYDQLVCRIHLGLMQGALAELRAPVTAARLDPFAEPDACVARLEQAGAAGPGPGRPAPAGRRDKR
jgi:predicted ArsR family transcriptional regulator